MCFVPPIAYDFELMIGPVADSEHIIFVLYGNWERSYLKLDILCHFVCCRIEAIAVL